MRDKYWKQVFALAEKKEWQKLCLLVAKNRWLATASMSTSLLPDYLAKDKDYGLLRLLANVEDIPVEVIREIISLGAKDTTGRCYLVRLLAGDGESEEAPSDSPLVAAELLRTTKQPIQIIHQMQRTLEQGINDSDAQRRALAERCLDRSQLFFDLTQLLQEEGMESWLVRCLECEELLLQLMDHQKRNWETVRAFLEVCNTGNVGLASGS